MYVLFYLLDQCVVFIVGKIVVDGGVQCVVQFIYMIGNYFCFGGIGLIVVIIEVVEVVYDFGWRVYIIYKVCVYGRQGYFVIFCGFGCLCYVDVVVFFDCVQVCGVICVGVRQDDIGCFVLLICCK